MRAKSCTNDFTNMTSRTKDMQSPTLASEDLSRDYHARDFHELRKGCYRHRALTYLEKVR